MNILLLCCDIHSDICALFRSAAGADGTLFVAGTNPWCSALYENDPWHLVPDVSEPAFISQVLQICRDRELSCVIPLDPRIRTALIREQNRFARDGIILIHSEAAMEATFPGQPALLSAWQACFVVKQPPLTRRIYKSLTACIPMSFKEWLSLRSDYLTTYQENKRTIRLPRSRIVYLLDVPTHDNLGDHAIAYAQRKFLEKALPDAQILEIPVQLVEMHLPFIRRHLRPDDLFCMIGGGNFGDAYLMHEYTKRKVCSMFPDNRVIIFPQTISFSDTPQGRRELKLTQEALNRHRRLTITARDKVSHQRARCWFPEAESILTPDIVLSLEAVSTELPRKGILCCLRQDQERSTAIHASDVLNALGQAGYAFSLSDTISSHGVSIRQRPDELAAKWREFQGSELVITDRLHGMIFSCITATPCVVLDNSNHKIRNFYDTWLRDVPSVRFAQTAEDILPLVTQMHGQHFTPWDPSLLADKYAPLLEALRKED